LRSQGIEFSRMHSTGRKITLRSNRDANDKRGKAGEISVGDAKDAKDAKIHTSPVSALSKEVGEREIGNTRKIASVASGEPQPALRLACSPGAKNNVASFASEDEYEDIPF
jgi:hypothetical protein